MEMWIQIQKVKNGPQKNEEFMFLRPGRFSCSLNALHRGIGIRIQICIDLKCFRFRPGSVLKPIRGPQRCEKFKEIRQLFPTKRKKLDKQFWTSETLKIIDTRKPTLPI
jgi:hypothetical protein